MPCAAGEQPVAIDAQAGPVKNGMVLSRIAEAPCSRSAARFGSRPVSSKRVEDVPRAAVEADRDRSPYPPPSLPPPQSLTLPLAEYLRCARLARRRPASRGASRGRVRFLTDGDRTRRNAGRVEVLLVCSTGGHLLQLVALRERVGGLLACLGHVRQERRPLAARGRARRPRLRAHEPRLRNLVRNLGLAWRVIATLRPRAVLTTGAGVAVPFAWIGRLRGARVVYVESITRIDGALAQLSPDRPVTARVYVQWPELASAMRGSRYVGKRLRRPVIFVTVGTNEAPFDRLSPRGRRAPSRRGDRRPARPLGCEAGRRDVRRLPPVRRARWRSCGGHASSSRTQGSGRSWSRSARGSARSSCPG